MSRFCSAILFARIFVVALVLAFCAPAAQAQTESNHFFVHSATAANRHGGGLSGNPYITTLDNLRTNNNPNAVLQVTQNFNPLDAAGIYNAHAIGVVYNTAAARWEIFNQDGAGIPLGASFNVRVLAASGRVVGHFASSANISGNATTINNPFTSNNPRALLYVTQLYTNTYNRHHIGVYYDGTRWQIFNQDGAAMPANARFFVEVRDPGAYEFVLRARDANRSGHLVTIDHPALNDNPNAHVHATPNFNPGGASGVFNNHPTGVYYNGTRWFVFNENLAAVNLNARFNILIASPHERTFTHETASGNIFGSETLITHPLANNDPNVLLQITSLIGAYGIGVGGANPHPASVKYVSGRWAILNENLANVFPGVNFTVKALAPSDRAFIHTATSVNVASNYTVINHPLLNDKPNAIFHVTKNLRAGNVFNPHAVGVFYTGTRWAIFNQDLAAMPVGVAFNIEVLLPAANVFTHRAVAGVNIFNNFTTLNHPLANNPRARVLVTQNYNPGGAASGVYNNNHIAAAYSGASWDITNQCIGGVCQPIPDGASFNVEIIPPPPLAGNGKIAFVSDRDPEIFTMNRDGSEVTQLTFNTTGDFSPAWSPDGLRLTFVSTRDGAGSIYLMHADGGAQRPLIHGEQSYDHAWSPDNSFIASSTVQSGEQVIIYRTPDGMGASQPDLTSSNPDHLAWSPDASKVVFTRGFGDIFDPREIIVADRSGANEVNITNNEANDHSPAWQPLPPLAQIGDLFVRGADADCGTNFGKRAEMQVKRTFNPGSGRGRQSYLKFHLGTEFANTTVRRATLRVYGRLNAVTGANQNIPTAVFGVPDTAWTELALNWNNKPTPTLPELTRVNIPDATARWYEFDITNFVNAKLGAGEDAVSLLLRNMLRGEAGDFYTTFNSREAARNQPQLVIEKF